MHTLDKHIEVATTSSQSTTEKGAALEKLAGHVLTAQSCEVKNNIRKTGVELDLLAEHNINKRRIYVECKAYREKINSDTLKKLLGTLLIDESLDEGWLISTSQLNKDAKGIYDDWSKKKDSTIRAKLSIYSSEKLIDLLENTGIIKPPPAEDARHLLNKDEKLGTVYLLLTSQSYFWAFTVLEQGIPQSAYIYDASTSLPIQDQATIRYIESTDSSLKDIELKVPLSTRYQNYNSGDKDMRPVVQVTSGDEWTDYRPARPGDFVGRTNHLKQAYEFLGKVVNRKTPTRVLAITGGTGIGKSSFLAKLRSTSKRGKNRQKVFVYAVDVRAADAANYITSAIIQCLAAASKSGFGTVNAGQAIEGQKHTDTHRIHRIEGRPRIRGSTE